MLAHADTTACMRLHTHVLTRKWVQWGWGSGRGSVRGEGGGDGQQRARVASVREQEGDQQVGTNRHGAWVAGVCCVCMACTLHSNGVGRGGRASGSGERAGGGVRALDAVGVARHACGTWHQWRNCMSHVAVVVVGGSAVGTVGRSESRHHDGEVGASGREL